MSHFRVPIVDFIWDGIKGHDLLHEWGGDSSGEETDQDIVVRDAGTSGVTLECQDVALKRRRELPVLFDHVMGRQPGNGVPGCVLVLKSLLELLKEVVPTSKGDGGVRDGVFSESVCPSQGRPFGHVGQGKRDFLCISIIGFLIYHKVELDGMHLGDCSLIGAIEGFGFSELELGRF